MAIPFLSTPDKAITDTAQDLLPIAEITDGIVIYKNGGAALIMESTSLNFGLLSEREQIAVIASYAGLLNSFNFPVQIVIRSQKKDISNYMVYLEEAQKKRPSDAYLEGRLKIVREGLTKKEAEAAVPKAPG